MQGDRELCLAAGMDDYVSKPIRVESLVAALAGVQSHEEAGDEGVKGGGGEGVKARAESGRSVRRRSGSGVIDETPALSEVEVAVTNLLEITGGDPEFLAEMIDSYLETTPPLLLKLHDSLAANDAAAFRLAAHTLKSGSADFGAMSLSQLCARLEEMGKSGELNGAADLVNEAEGIYEQVKIALTAVRDEQINGVS
jgi:HPt (histidine-containing phosphotransfer) domain-containing protein